MKYAPAPLTPFLAPLPENSHRLQIDRSPIPTTPPKLNSSLSYSSKLFVVAKKLNSFAIKQIQTLSQKHPGWGYAADSLFTGHQSRVTSHGFSTTYELPPPSHRFASRVFSFTCELLFSQLPCFQKHLRCPLVFPNPTKICSPPPAAVSFSNTPGVGVDRISYCLESSSLRTLSVLTRHSSRATRHFLFTRPLAWWRRVRGC